uniref:Ovule protein n=1 Tax=Echinococcus granulosus TaxID=6210 RepID=A0A068X2X1_ECHGR|nr:hypothetical protein EgrG_002064500 [Echinococcus granulosus]
MSIGSPRIQAHLRLSSFLSISNSISLHIHVSPTPFSFSRPHAPSSLPLPHTRISNLCGSLSSSQCHAIIFLAPVSLLLSHSLSLWLTGWFTD